MLQNSSTSDPDLSAEDVALGSKNLLDAERAFRDLKTTLELRPVYHRLDRRIRAHVLLCWLALLLVRVTERATGQPWRQGARELGRLHLVALVGPDGRVEHTTHHPDHARAAVDPHRIEARTTPTDPHAHPVMTCTNRLPGV